MKEDILEQLVDDYLMHKGYLTRHNVRYKPSPRHRDYNADQDRVASDIDVVAVHPLINSEEGVVVVSSKAWQGGFDPARHLAQIVRADGRVAGREAWKPFRELVKPKWGEAFVNKIAEITGRRRFVYWTVTTLLLNTEQRSLWEANSEFRANLGGNPIRLVTLREMLDELWRDLTKTPAASDVGRMLQLMKAARWVPPALSSDDETVNIVREP
jgi:hypothetical protein